MLDERRKEILRNISIKSIRPNGVLWIFGDNVRTYQLTKEDIRYLRWYHNDPNIAKDVDVRLGKRNYKLAQDRNKYNHGHRVNKRANNNGIKKTIIVGSLVVSVILGAAFTPHHSQAQDLDDVVVLDMTGEVNNTSNIDELASTLVGIANKDDEIRRIETIKHLCDIYQVDYKTIFAKLKELTNNFTGSDYLNGHIDGVTCKGYDVYASNEEELLTYAVRAMKQLPERFGFDDSVFIHNGYSSGDDYFAQISDVCEVLGLDRNLMYAIVNAETSFDSDMFRTINNPAGLRGINGTDPWWVFENKEEGFLEFGMELVKYYKLVGRDKRDVSPDAVQAIGNIHAPLSDGNANWLPNVLNGLEYAENNENSLFGGEEVHGLGR